MLLRSQRRLNMYAVGRVGNFVSQGLYTVSGPFHPFGGAVDIIVVKQEDGTYKSSPWYVKFGKFQGVLKRSEKVVDVAVNDEAVNCHMYLDAAGTTEGRELWILCCHSPCVSFVPCKVRGLGIEGVCICVLLPSPCYCRCNSCGARNCSARSVCGQLLDTLC